MKAVILAGGSGSRLYPITQVVNKHLLPIYNKPMIYYPLSIAMLARIKDIAIIVNPDDKCAYQKLLGDGSRIGINLKFLVQQKPHGLAEGLIIAEEFINKDCVLYLLGDNIFYGHDLPKLIENAINSVVKNGGASIFCYPVLDPERFGIAEIDKTGNVLSIKEKPTKPKSNLAIVGMYFYDEQAVSIAKKIKPSKRGELEITSVNEEYLKVNKLRASILGRGYAWFDAGTHYSFLEAGNFVATIETKTGYMIGCIEEIAFRNGWITANQLTDIAEKMHNSDYGKYLLKITEQDAI